MKRPNLNEPKAGEVWTVALGEDQYGYIRILKGAAIGVIPVISRGIIRDMNCLQKHAERWFFGFIQSPAEQTNAQYVGELPFADASARWMPPTYTPPDIFHPHYRIHELAKIRRAEGSEIQGLQQFQRMKLDGVRRFIVEHRNELFVLDGDTSIAQPVKEPAMGMGNEGSVLLEIVFLNADFSFHGRDEIEDPLTEALDKAGVGEVTGGGSGPVTCNIDVEVFNLTGGLDVIRQTLRKLNCPDSTEIHQHQPQHIVYRL